MAENPTKVELEELSEHRAYLNKELRDNLSEYLWLRCQKPLIVLGGVLFCFFTWYLKEMVATNERTNDTVVTLGSKMDLVAARVDSNQIAIAEVKTEVKAISVMQQRLGEHENRLRSLEDANRAFQSELTNIRAMLSEIRGRLEGAAGTQKQHP